MRAGTLAAPLALFAQDDHMLLSWKVAVRRPAKAQALPPSLLRALLLLLLLLLLLVLTGRNSAQHCLKTTVLENTVFENAF